MGAVSFRVMPLQVSYLGFAGNLAAGAISFLIVRLMDFPHAWMNVVIKGSAALLIYALLVCLMNPTVRRVVLNWRKAAASQGEKTRPQLVVN